MVIKARWVRKDTTAHIRINDFRTEYEILKKCADVINIPRALHYAKTSEFEILILDYLPGLQLQHLRLTFRQTVNVFFRVFIIAVRLSNKGICHNDITPQNILLTDKYFPSLVDFDQSVKTSFTKALAGNIFGIKSGDSIVSYGVVTIIKDFLRKKFPNFLYFLKRLLGKNPKFEKHELPQLGKDADENLKKLRNAWKLAQKSNASAPALPLAYYAIDFGGFHFPGERPWSERWERLKSLSEFSGKNILELGCNMGLLSIHLLKEEGVVKCIGVDHDKKILESAKLISEVFNVHPKFLQINFDSARDWESDLISEDIDIVFALNVLNWVDDKDRFLRFLSNFDEIIFEGHDTPEVEKKRFERIGFSKIEEIGYSERERIILRCRK